MATKYAGQNALNKLMQLVKTAMSGKLDKAGGTITGNLKVNGDFEPVKGLTTSGGINAQSVSTPVLALHDNGVAGANASINVSGVGAVEVTVPDGDKRAKARMKVGTPTEDDDAVTKAYEDAALDGKLDKTGGTLTGFLRVNDSSYVEGSIDVGNNISAKMLQLNAAGSTEDNPVLVDVVPDDSDVSALAVWATAGSAGLKRGSIIVATPTDSQTNYAATVEFVKNKVSGLQTADQVQAAISSAITGVYTPKGSIAFASLPTAAAGNKGWVYNISDAFTTTAAFVEGAGHSYGAGTNVVCVDVGSGSYKWDVLAGTIDLTELTAAEVQTLWDSI